MFYSVREMKRLLKRLGVKVRFYRTGAMRIEHNGRIGWFQYAPSDVWYAHYQTCKRAIHTIQRGA